MADQVTQALLAGMALGTVSVISIGPNNLMMMREGLRRGNTGLVAGTVLGSNVLLQATACGFADAIAKLEPGLRTPLSIVGLVVLAGFALSSFMSATRIPAVGATGSSGGRFDPVGLRRALATVWLNPLTYVECLLIPAALCSTYAQPFRAPFVFGLMVMASVKCAGYSYGGSLCASIVRHPRTVQVFDFASSVVLSVMAGLLATNLLGRLAQ